MEFRTLTQFLYLPIETASIFNDIQVFRKLTLRTFKLHKNRQERIRSHTINGRWKLDQFCTIKLARTASDFFLYYQTFAQVGREKVILSNFAADGGNIYFYTFSFSKWQICAYIYSHDLLIYIHTHSKSQPRAFGAGRNRRIIELPKTNFPRLCSGR